MDIALRECGLENLIDSFRDEKVTPDICHMLNEGQLDSLGVPRNRFIRNKLRQACASRTSTEENGNAQSMEQVLQEVNLAYLAGNFSAEKITPEICCMLSPKQLDSLGVPHDLNSRKKLKKACSLIGMVIEPEKSDDYLEKLVKAGCTAKQVARIMSVCEKTIYRKLDKLGQSARNYSEISVQQLQEEIVDIRKEHPNAGEVMMKGLLSCRNIRVPRKKLREACHLIDKAQISQRKRGRLRRRQYHVPGPNHLWHIDGNHKLIRWGFVVHGCIDGYSRKPLYLLCATNNRAATVLDIFRAAVRQYGLPLRVRSDCGGENVRVRDFMELSRGAGSGSMIMGKSTHNQRIERLWRDVYEGTLCTYYDKFSQMEEDGILNVLDMHHMFCLHFVFKERINRSLENWIEAWNFHLLRTVGMTPNQLWMTGHHPTNNDAVLQDLNDDAFDEMAEENATVELADIDVGLSEGTLNELKDKVNPLAESDSYGQDLFQQVKTIIELSLLN